MTWRLVMMAGAATLAVAACSKPSAPEAEAGAAAGTPQAASQAATPPQAPPALPKRRPGLWKQTVIGSGMTQVSRICLDEAAEARLAIWGAQTGKDICAEQDVRPTPGGWAFHSRCDMGSGGTVVSEGTATGDFNTRYTVQVQSTTSGAAAPQMNGAHKVSMASEWLGPCPAGMAPGDMELPNGMKINMLKLGGK